MVRRAIKRANEPTILPMTGAAMPPTGRLVVDQTEGLEFVVEHYAPELAADIRIQPHQSAYVSGDGSLIVVHYRVANPSPIALPVAAIRN